MKSLILINGNKRTGTNLLRAILSSHPEVISSVQPPGPMRKKLMAIERLAIIRGQMKRLYQLYGFNDYDKHLLIKRHNLLPLARSIKWNMVDCVMINIIRDPRASYASRKIASPDLNITPERESYDFNKGYYDSWYCTRILGDAFMEVRYEDLIEDTENIIKEICGFIRISFINDMLNFDKYWNQTFDGRGHSIKTATSNSSFNKNTNDLIYKTSINKWKEVLSSDEINTINGLCSYEMKEKRYI